MSFAGRKYSYSQKRERMPCRILCNGTYQKSYEARSGLDLASSHGTSLHNKRYGVRERGHEGENQDD